MRKIFLCGILVATTDKKPSDLKRLRGFQKQVGPNSFNFTSAPSFLVKAA